VYTGDDISEELWGQCSELFSNHYSVWGAGAGEKLAGRRVKKSAKGLKDQLLFPGTRLVVAFFNGLLVGHAFSCSFSYSACGRVCVWITQLVVHLDRRAKGVAQCLCGNPIAMLGGWFPLTRTPSALWKLQLLLLLLFGVVVIFDLPTTSLGHHTHFRF